ncbi:MAG: cell division protein FtsL [Pseudomonadota bacterium]|jgi:cell division protein FtsL
MSRMQIVLLLLVMGCALGVVNAQHHARQLFVALQQAQAQQRQLDVEWGQLQLEQSTWAMHGRIEKLAVERLHMQVPAADRVQIVNAGGSQ